MHMIVLLTGSFSSQAFCQPLHRRPQSEERRAMNGRTPQAYIASPRWGERPTHSHLHNQIYVALCADLKHLGS